LQVKATKEQEHATRTGHADSIDELLGCSSEISELRHKIDKLCDADALVEMGDRHVKGDGVERNLSLAANYFQQAAQQWHPQGQERWGTLLWTGQGTADSKPDKHQAVKLFKQAAGKGIPGALYGNGN
jgi:TPR repeat protein